MTAAAVPSEELRPGPTSPAAEVAVVNDLLVYADLKKIVIPTEHDRELKSRLLSDTDLIRKAKSRLLNIESSRSDLNIAVDFLIEAAASKDGHEAATIALTEIVVDAHVEDSDLNNHYRESLAETKADVLYRWISQEPSIGEELTERLPGPVSQKIYANVIAAQSNNRMESRLVGLSDR